MLATPGPLPTGAGWSFEVKWDGMRVLAEVTDGGGEPALRLRTRSGRDVTANFPELAGLVDLAPDVLLDGEVVLLDGGVPSFAALAHRIHGPVGGRPVTFMVFDVLRLYGVPLLDRPLAERRATLERLDLSATPHVETSPLYPDGAALLEVTASRGLEGVVAKREDSRYRPGRRSPDWVKIAHRHSQSCVVGGWKPERSGAAGRIGALLLGVPGPDGLEFAGRVGSGLAGAAVQELLTARLTGAPESPFAQVLPRVDAAGARWCSPTVVAEVAHLGWTAAGRLRQPVFRGIRDDVDAADVRREPR
ncbi:non-homologous end-joining DNA ligase [Pseudonocardia alni]|jgi:bifunctional non-homologous end joining protein LigD|uniref:non-homologous end-joining DNA ligase n=1 Tax=Pseudonocardia TaxID=1847 RepID=UPI000916827D|nr:non-homologous end-joining DNA ligase [Pseudonocardia sp. SID8383]MYW73351.1 DNA ligase [Pseudonocardia sp. SID8383]OJG06497.1 putative DNA ligase-like protein [Pseudonocardia autotrophica]